MINRKLYFVAALALVLALALTACMGDGAKNGAAGDGANYVPNANNPTGTTGSSGTNSSTGTDGVNGTSGATGTSGSTGTSESNTGNAGNTSSTAGGALSGFDWANGAAEIERAIGQLSEIADCRVVVTNSTALVGVKFDNVYKGELTERIREMVAAEVMKADPGIQTVAVTSDANDVAKIYALSDQIRAGRTADELSADINAIVRNATTMR